MYYVLLCLLLLVCLVIAAFVILAFAREMFDLIAWGFRRMDAEDAVEAVIWLTASVISCRVVYALVVFCFTGQIPSGGS